MALIDISEPSPQANAGFKTILDIFFSGKRIGYVEKNSLLAIVRK